MSELIRCHDQLGQLYDFTEQDFVNREAFYGIVVQDERILLVQDSLSGKWEVPGGAKDGAESDYECLAREFFEETGLELGAMLKEADSFVSYFFDLTSRQPWKTRRSYWLVTIAGGTMRAHGNDEDVQCVDKIPVTQLGQINIDEKVARAIGKAITINSRPE